jgi:hypothetical protein
MTPSQYVPILMALLAVLAILWRTSALTTRLELTISALEKEVEALKAERKHLAIIPDISKRVEQLEEIVAELTSTLRGKGQDDGLVTRLRVIERKLSGQMPAVQIPRPDTRRDP